MQIQYRNNREDFETWFEWSQRATKKKCFDQYLFAFAWQLGICGLGIFVSWQTEQLFPAIIFIICAGMFLKQNWSFSQTWKKAAADYSQMCDEYTASLSFDAEGITERFLGLVHFCPWAQIRSYAVFQNRLFIRHLKNRAVIIPLEDLKNDEQKALVDALKSRGVREGM